MSHRPSRLRQAEEDEGAAVTGIRFQRELRAAALKLVRISFAGYWCTKLLSSFFPLTHPASRRR
jgi:hypothetical protein